MQEKRHGRGSKQKPGVGTQARALSDLSRYLADPDAPMVAPERAMNNLRSTDNMNIAPSKLYEDGGRRMAVVQYLAERGRDARMPTTPEGLYANLESYLAFCLANKVPPTIGLFAVWNGVSLARLNQIGRDKSRPEMMDAIDFAKETIRGFVEISAMDGGINPIVYFHQNKVYYGAVENQQVTVRMEDNAGEISTEEYRERVAMLLEQGEDGVWRAVDDD